MSEYRTDRCGWKQTRACYGSNGGQQSLAALRPQGMSCGCHQLQWRQATWLVLYRFRACRSLSSVMPTFLLLSVLAFVLLPHLGVLGTFPSPLPFLFVVRKEAYVAYIFQYPECWYSDLPSCHFFFLALPCFLSLCFLLYASLFFFLLLRTSVSLQPAWFSGLCRFRCSNPVRAWPNIVTVCAMYIAPGRLQYGLWPL